MTSQLRVETTATDVRVFRDGSPDPIIVQNAARDRRPFIHPIIAPDAGASVTEDAPSHHPWQHGLYVGLNDVNGVGFWSEGLHPKQPVENDGTFHPSIVGVPSAQSNRARWTVGTEYRSYSGEVILFETQEWSLVALDDRYELDLRLTFRAALPIEFGEYAYGGLFLRMPFRAELGGRVFTSEGLEGSAAEGQRARWVTSEMPLSEGTAPIAVSVLDHPANPRHPVPWRVDNELGIGPSVSIAGSWQLDAGEAAQFNHRVVVFATVADTAQIDAEWDSFSREVSV
jgi:hypothetical protein